MKRLTFNDALAKWEAEHPELAQTPELADLNRRIDEAFGTTSDAERYAAAECADARQCVKGRGED